MMSFGAANEFLRKRENMPTGLNSHEISEEFDARIRAQSFFSSRVSDTRVLKLLRRLSDRVSRGDMGIAEARTFLKRYLAIKRPGVYDPENGAISNLASTGRLNLVFRQNAAMAAAVGRYQVSRDPDVEERWPSWRYISGPNPRDDHARLDGKVYLKSDPIWHKIYPPWEFNCNCDVEDSDEAPETARKEDYPDDPESGYKFDPAHAFEVFDLSRVEDAGDRQRIFAEMRDRFGAEEMPDGTLQIGERKAGKKAIEQQKQQAEYDEGMRAIGHIWRREELKNIQREFMQAEDDIFDGVTITNPDGVPMTVKVFRNSPYPALTMVHETGHVIDMVFWSSKSKAIDDARKDLIALLKDTDEYRKMNEMRDKLSEQDTLSKKKQKELKRYDYLMQDGELLARGYAQFVAKENGGKLLEESKKAIKVKPNEFFSSKEDEIAKKYRELLKLTGLENGKDNQN